MNNMTRIITACGLLFAALSVQNAWGYTYTCQTTSGRPVTLNASFGAVTITDPAQNTSGQELGSAASWNNKASASILCDTPAGTGPRYFSGSSTLPVASNDGTRTWYNVNEYLNAAIKTSGRYIPFSNVHTANAGDHGGNMQLYFGTSGTLDLYIKKAFVGSTAFNNIHLADIYLSHKSGVYSPTPLLSVYMNGTVSVPQNCTVNSGTVIHLNLGNMYSSDFTTAGEKPENFTPKSFNVPVSCNYGASLANLTLRMTGTPSAQYSDALKTDNNDVGVRVTDTSGVPLRPGDNSSTIPLTLNAIDSDTYTTTVTLEAYPISTTGTAPVGGTFTALAVLRVDFA